MVKLRLRRVGKKKQPVYRLVAVDSRNPRDGKIIENLGHYNPCTNPPTSVFNEEKILSWLKRGALPSDVVKKVFIKSGLWERFTGKVEAPKYTSAKAPKKKAQERIKKEQESKEKAAQSAPAAAEVEPQVQAENTPNTQETAV